MSCRSGTPARRADRTERLRPAPPGRRDLPLSSYDEGVRAPRVPHPAAGAPERLPPPLRRVVRAAPAVPARHAGLLSERRLSCPAARRAAGRRHPAQLARPEKRAGFSGRMPGGHAEGASGGAARADAQHVQLAEHPADAGAAAAPADRDRRGPAALRRGTGQSARRMRPHHELFDVQRHLRDEPPVPPSASGRAAAGRSARPRCS